MNRFTQFLKDQSRAIELMFVLCAIAGLLAYLTLPSDVYPELIFPRISVIADAGDIAPERMVVAVTRPLELAVGEAYNVKWVRSSTLRGAADLDVQFTEGTDMAFALQQVQSKIGEIRSSLPGETNLTIERVTPAIFPVIIYNVSADALSLADLKNIAQYQIVPALTRVPGVARVQVQGGDVQEVRVQIDPAKLEAVKLTIDSVVSAIQKSNVAEVLGRFNENYQQTLLVAADETDSLSRIQNIVVGSTKTGAAIYLKNIGTAVWGIADRSQLVSCSGKLGLALNIFRQPSSNVVAVSKGVSDELATLRKRLPLSVRIQRSYDVSRLVIDAINNVRDAILTGVVLIIVVLFVFLREWRSTLIAAITIPLSALAAFGIMKLLGQSLNLMSLGGIAVAIGLVIDDAVVVIENIDHQLRKGLLPFDAVREALHELVAPVVSSTITTVVVFVPLGLLSGVAGEFFTTFTLTLSAAVIFSLVLSLSLTPMLSSRYLKPATTHKGDSIPYLADAYPRTVKRMFAHPWLVTIVALVLVGLAVIFAMNLGSDFLPAVDEGAYMLDYKAPEGSSIEETNSVAQTLEGILAKTPEVIAWTRRTGAESGLYATQTNSGDIQVVLKPSSERHRTVWQIIDEQRKKAKQLLPQADIDFHQILQDNLNDLSGTPSPVDVKIFGQNIDVLRALGDRMSDKVKDVPGLKDVQVAEQTGGPQTDVTIDATDAGRLGLSTQDVATQIQTAVLGGISTQMRLADRLIDVRVTLSDWFRQQAGQVKDLPIVGTNGLVLPLGAVATISEVPSVSSITRENQQRYIAIDADVQGADLGSVIANIKRRLTGFALPAGYTYELGGTYNDQQQAFAQLLEIFAFGVLLVYLVLLVQFRSWAEPLTIFTSIPLSLFGVFLALLITGSTLNVSSLMGVILLVGLVVKNGIILIDRSNRNLAAGMPLDDALIEAGSVRLRPILMTTLCTILGLIPLALGFGAGAEMQKPLAIAVIGGLTFSTFFTLLFMPMVLRAIVSRRHRTVIVEKPER